MTEEDIEAEWWAYHYQESKASVEFDDDDENAASDYMAQIIAEAEAEEAAAAAAGGAAPAAEPAKESVEAPVVDPNDWGPEE